MELSGQETVRSRVIRFVTVAAIYIASDRAGTLLDNPQTHISPVWPATGACLLALHFFGFRVWPAVLAGALLAGAWTPGITWEVIPFSFSNLLEALVGALIFLWVLNRLPFRKTIRETLAVLAVSVAAPIVGALCGALTLKYFFGQTGDEFWENLLAWWAGDAVGVLVVAPAVLAVHNAYHGSPPIHSDFRRRIPPLFLLVVAVCFLVFWNPWGGVSLFLLFPTLLFAGYWLGPPGANITACLLVSVGAWSTVASHGPFAQGSLDQSLLHLDLFAVSLPLASMLLSILGEEGDLLWPGVVLVAGWALSGWLFTNLSHQGRDIDDAQFKRLELAAERDVEQQMSTYTEALWGAASFLSLSRDVDPPRWKQWVDAQRLLERHPGIRGLGIVQPVTDANLGQFLKDARSRLAPDFTIKRVPADRPPPPQPVRFIVSLIEPVETNRRAIGLDFSSEANRLQALLDAAKTGLPTMTSDILLYRDDRHLKGFHLILPIYQPGVSHSSPQERLNALDRFVFATFVADVFFHSALGRTSHQIEADVFEGAEARPQNWIFSTGGKPRNHFVSTTPIVLAGRTLTLAWNRGPEFIDQQNTAAIWASGLLATLTLLAAFLVTSLQSVGSRANRIAEERTAALAASRDALSEALVAADAANRTKSEFLAVMSHEIRTPLAGLLGMNSLLSQTKLSAEQSEYVRATHLCGEGLSALIQDILDFSKIESGQLVLEPRPFSLRQSIREAVTVLAESAAARDLELTYAYARHAPEFVIGDVGRLRQVLLNLIGNAVKFTNRGSVRVYLNCLEKNSENLLVSVSVEDTGIGIPQAALPKLFVGFTQADATSKRRHGGAGLGLAISKRLVELMGGTLAVQSEEGVGSTFTFTLRLPICATPSADLVSNAQNGAANVLVVDDSAGEASDLVRFLQRGGLRYRLVRSAKQALLSFQEARLNHDNFDAIFVPESMPESLLALNRALEAQGDGSKSGLILIRDNNLLALSPALASCRLAHSIVRPLHANQVFEALAKVTVVTSAVGPDSFGNHKLSAPKWRVLIVEDNLTNQKILGRLLEKLGHSVEVASNGSEALQKWTSGVFDVILMDCQMPEMDGFEATRSIRASEQGRSHVPIIAVTANAMPGDREKCVAAGMDGFVPKPIKIEDLISAIEQAMTIGPATASINS